MHGSRPWRLTCRGLQRAVRNGRVNGSQWCVSIVILQWLQMLIGTWKPVTYIRAGAQASDIIRVVSSSPVF